MRALSDIWHQLFRMVQSFQSAIGQGKMFKAVKADECCLCGSTENLTGEHKIKAAALRDIFGSEKMLIGHFDGTSEPKVAQGPKSKNLHFQSKLCSDCNSTTTQPADRAFDRLHKSVSTRFAIDQNPYTLFPDDELPVGSPDYLNVFRYFAKLLVCQMVDAGGPSLPYVAAFATGLHDRNIIKLKIQADLTYQDINTASPDFGAFAGHGGLVVDHSKSGELKGFHSTLTLGPIQYVYFIEFNGSVLDQFKEEAPEFYTFTRRAFEDALINPMSDHQRRKLGLD